jgi:hypothetical protein
MKMMTKKNLQSDIKPMILMILIDNSTTMEIAEIKDSVILTEIGGKEEKMEKEGRKLIVNRKNLIGLVNLTTSEVIKENQRRKLIALINLMSYVTIVIRRVIMLGNAEVSGRHD